MKMYFFMDANMQCRGPYALQVLVTFIAPHTLVWTEGMAQWAPAGTIPEIAKALGISSHPSQPPFVNHEGPYVGALPMILTCLIRCNPPKKACIPLFGLSW